ncbi:hypothetical protein ACJW30_06G175700 [Castanea mollissima]
MDILIKLEGMESMKTDRHRSDIFGIIILGCFSVFPVASAIIADSFLGSFPVVLIFSFVSLLGMIMFTLTATIHSLRPAQCVIGSYTCETPSNLQHAVLYMTLGLASLGLGGTRFTIATMGAEQFEKANDQGIFFNYFSVIVYIQDNVGWGLGFGICAIANAIAVVLFVMGKRFYRQVKPKGSPFTSIARVIIAAIRKRKLLGTFGNQDNYLGTTSVFLNCEALITESDKQMDGSYARSWKLCTVEEVEALKTIIRIIPIWSTGIFISLSVGILNSLTILQVLTMNRHLGRHFEIPAGSFTVFNLIATTVAILFIDRLLIPIWRKITFPLIEIRRLHVVRTHSLIDQPSLVLPISALWLVVPLTIIGIGEGFIVPSTIALYYQEFPKSLKSTSTAMVSLLLAIGLFLSPAIVDLIDRITGWLPDNINAGRLDNVYWILTVIGVLNFGCYLICVKLFKYQNVEEHDGPSVLALQNVED